MAAIVSIEEQPISRTYQYRKVMKPMLERKRRARINRCLDELKELLVGALQAEGESVSRLEKADVLEYTVRHLHKLRRSQQLAENSANDRFRAGFSHCAAEVSKYVTRSPPPIDINVSARLLSHLDHLIHSIEPQMIPNQSTHIPLLSLTPPSSPNASTQLTNQRIPPGIFLQSPSFQPPPEEPFDLSSGSLWRPW